MTNKMREAIDFLRLAINAGEELGRRGAELDSESLRGLLLAIDEAKMRIQSVEQSLPENISVTRGSSVLKEMQVNDKKEQVVSLGNTRQIFEGDNFEMESLAEERKRA